MFSALPRVLAVHGCPHGSPGSDLVLGGILEAAVPPSGRAGEEVRLGDDRHGALEPLGEDGDRRNGILGSNDD